MTKGGSGLVDSSGVYSRHSKVLDIISEDATKVIPLVTAHESEEAIVWTVAATQSFKNGHIPQIYMSWETSPATSHRAISLNLKDTGKHLNGHFSVVSRNSALTRALILGSYLSPTKRLED